MNDFEKKVLDAFKNSEFSSLLYTDSRIGIAVSGGADSVSLLLSLTGIFKKQNIFVLTVNHNIRPYEESMGDCLFVQELCSRLGVQCTVFQLPPGLVQETVEERGGGIEEAARFLRYKCFDDFICDKKLDCLCLAHNLNDQLETLLMRFLQGSGSEGAAGISSSRGKYFRPLLKIERKEIEGYLHLKKQPYKTDSTNLDDSYLRNNIRLNLIPLLDKKFSGWKNSLLAGSEKASEDEKTLFEIASSVKWKPSKDGNYVSADSSINQVSSGIFRRCIYQGLKSLKIRTRLSYGFITQLYEQFCRNKEFSLTFEKIVFEKSGSDFFIKKDGNSKTEASFFCIIEEHCKKIEIPSCSIEIETVADGIVLQNKNDKKELKVFCRFPCVVRSVACGDRVLDSQGKLRDLNKILKNWHVAENKRKLIPVVEECFEKPFITAVAGSLLGYSDWIVKGNI